MAEARTKEQAPLQQEQDPGVGQLEDPEAHATAAGLLLQKKYMTFTEHQTIEAKDQLATVKPEPYPVLVHLQSLGPGEGASTRAPFTSKCLRLPAAAAPISLRPSTPRTPFKSTCPRLPAMEAPTSLRSSTLRTKVGRSLEAEARTQEQAALQQEKDQGVGKLEEPEAQAAPLGNQERRLHEFPSPRLAQGQDLLGQGGAGMIGECGQYVGRSLEAEARTQEQATLQQEQDQEVGLPEGQEAQATANGLLLQKKHMTFTEYQTLEAKDQLATTESEPCPVLVHLQSLGPGKGATPRTPVTLTCPRLPAGEALNPLRPSTRRTKVGRSLKAEART